MADLEPHDPLADDPRSNPGLSRGKALWIIAIMFGLVMGGYWLYAQYSARDTCEQVNQIYAASDGGRDLRAAQREATARGLEFVATEGSAGRVEVMLRRSGWPVGAWSTGPGEPSTGPHCIRPRHG